jgi:hypothetical protein
MLVISRQIIEDGWRARYEFAKDVLSTVLRDCELY